MKRYAIRKRILSLFLVVAMLLGMLPSQIFGAATEVSVSNGVVDITDTACGEATLKTLQVYYKGTQTPVPIVGATQDGTTIDVVLAADTDPAAELQVAFEFSNTQMLRYSGNTCSLTEGTGTMVCSVAAFINNQQRGQVSFTINFSLPLGEAVTVMPPIGEGFTFTGNEKAYIDSAYRFTVAVNEGYDCSNMVVRVNDKIVASNDGSYTIDKVEKDLTITVDGIVKKEICNITIPTGEGFTFSGDTTAYKGDSYTFKLTVDEAYDASEMVVTANNTELIGIDGNYTIDAVNEDTVITVTGLVKRAEYTVTMPTGKGFIFSGEPIVYAGADYGFSVTIASGYDGSNMTVRVNGEVVEGNNGIYTVANVREHLAITVENITRLPLPEREVPVAENVVDIDDAMVYERSNKYYVNATGIKLTGADVLKAYQESGSATVYIVLSWATPDEAEIGIEFQTYRSNTSLMSVTGTSGELKLEDGEGELSITLTGTYSNNSRYQGSKTYTLVFLREEAPKEKPVRIIETDSHDIYKTTSLTLNLADYFEGATRYYLVEGESRTLLEGREYTFKGVEPGEQTLVFVAENDNGECPDVVTVTINVTDIIGGIWVGHNTSSGSFDFVIFKDAEGNLIDGIEASFADKIITVILPKSYPVTGKVTAEFSLTQNASGYPFLSTKTATAGVSGDRADRNKFTNKDTTLSEGKGTLTFYYFNSAPNGSNQETFNLRYKVANDLPVFAGDSSVEANVTVGEPYELNVASLFTDVDGDNLTYQYKVESESDNRDWTNCDANFSYSNELSGQYTLSFRAYDGKDYSEDVYVVSLTLEDSKQTYPVQVVIPEGIEAEFYVSDENGSIGNFLTASLADTIYTVEVPNNAEYIAWRSDGSGMHTAVSANTLITLVNAEFVAMAGLSEDTGAVVTVKFGELEAVGNANQFLLLDGIAYSVKAAPANSGYNVTSITEYTPINGKNVISLKQKHFTVIAPAGSVVSAGTLEGSFAYKFATPISVVTENETIIYKFSPLDTNAFIRVQRPDDPDAVTYWDYKSKKTDGAIITVTEEMLFMNDEGDFDADTVYRNFEKYELDLADIYLNINAQGYINLEAGETKKLNSFRNWQAIESYLNSWIALPDFSYEIITIDGEDVVSIESDADNSAVATLTAMNPGTAIVLVTYDAMYSELTATGAGGGLGAGNRLSAIWPDRTGVFVVSVGKDGTGIKTNMICNGGTFDAEHSPQFYTGTEGASVSFKPEAGCEVTVSRGVVSDGKLGFCDFTNAGVTIAEDGMVTVSGLMTGRHIICVEKNGISTYQVVTAQQVEVDIKDADGNAVDENTVLNAGDKVTVTITGLTSPAEKLATAYNCNWQLTYFDEEGNSYKNSSGSSYGRYNFSSTPQVLSVTIPVDWTSDEITLNGYISAGGFLTKPIGGHREIEYKSAGMGSGAEVKGVNLGTLPEITLKVKSAPVSAESVTLDKESAELRVTENLTLTANVMPENATDKVVWTSSDETIAIVENGIVTAKAAGNVRITVMVGNFSASCDVTVLSAIEVTEIKLNQTFAKLEAGKLIYLTAAIGPEDATDKTVIWTSTNADVAAVDANGVVVTKSVGTAIITAKAGNVSADCTVIVEEKEDADDMVTAYLSISHDEKFLMSASGKAMVLQKVDVPYFDLALYGLDRYKIPETDVDYGKVTAMHLYIYATELFYCGISKDEAGKGYLYDQGILGTDVLKITGSAGSSYINKFWGYDENLNYYINYQYPVYVGTSIGATSDRIVLKDGDIVTIAHFDNYAFSEDPASVFNYITVLDADVTVGRHQSITLQLYRAGADMGNGGSNTPVKRKLNIYYAQKDTLTSGDVTDWTLLGCTDENGQLKMGMLPFSAGEYIFAVGGQYGENQIMKICSAPGGIVLNVLETDEALRVQNVMICIDKISSPVTLDSESDIIAARQAYAGLETDSLREAVANYQKLLDAEAELERLKSLEEDKDDSDEDNSDEDVSNEDNSDKDDSDKDDSNEDDSDDMQSQVKIEEIYINTGKYLENLIREYGLTVSATGGEWIVIALERMGNGIPNKDAYYQEVAKYVNENINTSGQLHRAKSTENSRLILALTALGYDVTNVDGHNLLVGLNDMEFVEKQGINGPIWALIAFDSHNYEIPAGGDVTRDKLIEKILSKQLSDGGWTLSGVNADVDMTAMALQALAPYYGTKTDVKTAVDKALNCLSLLQHEDGGFGSVDGACAESAAQVIVALTALKINPHTDSRFVKGDRSVVDALCSYYVDGGGFKHIQDGSLNGMATEQGQYALVSYFRFMEEKTSLYDMSDVTIQKEEADKEPEKEPDKEPEKEPEKEPDKEPEKEPDKEPEKEPDKEPEKKPEKEPDKEPEKEPDEKPEEAPDNEPGEEPDEEPQEDLEKEPEEEPDKDPNKETAEESNQIPEKTPATIRNKTDKRQNAFEGDLSLNDQELKERFLTDEEKKFLESGVKVDINMIIEDISNRVSSEDSALMEKHLGDYQIGVCMDISIIKQIGDSEAVKLTETNGEIEVRIVVPEELRNQDASVERMYKMLRIHEGKVDILDVVFDKETGVLSFETDVFSTYALIYKDLVVLESDLVDSNISESGFFDDYMVWVYVILALAVVVAFIGYKKYVIKK